MRKEYHVIGIRYALISSVIIELIRQILDRVYSPIWLNHWENRSPPGFLQLDVLPPATLEPLREWWGRAQRAYPEATLKAWRCDWVIYWGYCAARNLSPLPASPETVAGFVVYCKEAGKKPATVSRYLSTIARFHRAAQLFNPCASEAVQMEMKGFTSEVSVRQRQARGLGMAEIQAFLNSPGNNLPTLRERAMLCVAYDAMTRRSELIAIDVEDLKLLEDGTGTAPDPALQDRPGGGGHVAYLSRQTVGFLKAWLKAAGIKEGPVFRRIIGRGTVTYDKKGRGPDWGSTESRSGRPGIQGRGPVPETSRPRISRASAGTRYGSGRRRTCWR